MVRPSFNSRSAQGRAPFLDRERFHDQPTGSFTYNLRFPGQYYDRETKLTYNYFRDYDPKLGRYIESDPIGMAGGTNTYAYVGGNPVNYTDPRGLCIGPLIVYCTVEAITWGTVGAEFAFAYFSGYVNPTSVVAGEVGAAVGAASSEAKCAAERARGPYSNLVDPPSVGAGKNFSQTQKANIYQQNMQANGGVLRSDLDGEKLVLPSKSQSGITPPSNEAQIDHIDPRVPSNSNAQPGSNSYDNAQVLSRAQNRAKWNY